MSDFGVDLSSVSGKSDGDRDRGCRRVRGRDRSAVSNPRFRSARAVKPHAEILDPRALLAVNFTGNVVADFPANREGVTIVTPSTQFPFVQPIVQPNIADIVRISGFELSAVRLFYDRTDDTLSVGLEQPDNRKTGQRVIIGDIDNNLDGGGVDPALLRLLDDPDNFIDYARLGGRESAGLQFDFNRDGTFDAVAGVDDAIFLANPSGSKELQVARFRDPNEGGSRFGQNFPQFAGPQFIGEQPAAGAYEFQIRNFSQFHQTITGQALPQQPDFNILAFAGSANDGGTDEARLGGRVQLPGAPQANGLISGFVYKDNNNDGQRQTGEAGVSGATVTLTGTLNGGQTVALSTTTGADGAFQFPNLQPGTYKLNETQPPDCLDGKDTAGTLGGDVTNDMIANIVLPANGQSVNNLFGELRPASLSGSVYKDLNDNGIREASEQGVNNVLITLTGTDDLGQAVNATTRTTIIDGVAGAYRFSNLRPGTYVITETQPADCLDGKDTIGSLGGMTSNDRFSAIPVRPGDAGISYNFGEIPRSTPGETLASISGCVYVDLNDNGVKEAGEPAIPGTTITLTRPDGTVLRRTTTGADGCYQFPNLQPGTYCVAETQPSGFLDGKDSVGSAGGRIVENDRICEITLAGGVNAINYNFGERFRILANPHDQGHINTFADTLIRVNIFGGQGLDVSQIDRTTVRFGEAAPRWFLIHKIDDNQSDDLLLIFRAREVDLPRGPQDAVISGQLLSGQRFQSTVRVYNQPIFFPNDGASRPPRGVMPVTVDDGAVGNNTGAQVLTGMLKRAAKRAAGR